MELPHLASGALVTDPAPELAPALLAVLVWTSKGMTADQIGRRLNRTPNTVRTYQKLARIALDVPSMPAAVHRGYLRQLLPLPPAPAHVPQLTPREWTFLQLAADGQRFTDMTVALGVSISTVRALSQQTYHRLGARTAAHAVGVAHRMRLMDLCPTCTHLTGAHHGQ